MGTMAPESGDALQASDVSKTRLANRSNAAHLDAVALPPRRVIPRGLCSRRIHAVNDRKSTESPPVAVALWPADRGRKYNTPWSEKSTVQGIKTCELLARGAKKRLPEGNYDHYDKQYP